MDSNRRPPTQHPHCEVMDSPSESEDLDVGDSEATPFAVSDTIIKRSFVGPGGGPRHTLSSGFPPHHISFPAPRGATQKSQIVRHRVVWRNPEAVGVEPEGHFPSGSVDNANGTQEALVPEEVLAADRIVSPIQRGGRMLAGGTPSGSPASLASGSRDAGGGGDAGSRDLVAGRAPALTLPSSTEPWIPSAVDGGHEGAPVAPAVGGLGGPRPSGAPALFPSSSNGASGLLEQSRVPGVFVAPRFSIDTPLSTTQINLQNPAYLVRYIQDKSPPRQRPLIAERTRQRSELLTASLVQHKTVRVRQRDRKRVLLDRMTALEAVGFCWTG